MCKQPFGIPFELWLVDIPDACVMLRVFGLEITNCTEMKRLFRFLQETAIGIHPDSYGFSPEPHPLFL